MRRLPSLALLALSAALAGLPGAAVALDPGSRAQARGPIAAGDVSVRRDIQYAVHGGQRLLLDAYLPEGEGPRPGVILIPGGRWRNTTKDQPSNAGMAARLADRGLAVFAISYRPAPDYVYPEQLRDVQAAVRWVRSHAADLGVDPSAIGAVGASAGGHLAALLATMGEGPRDEGSRIQVAVAWSGPMHFPSMLGRVRAQVRQVLQAFLGCSSGPTCRRPALAASPREHVDETDAPAFLANGAEEVIPLQQATDMAAALEAAQVPYQLFQVAGDSHGYGYARSTKVFEPSAAFLEAWIDGRGPGPAVGAPAQGTTGKDSRGTNRGVPEKEEPVGEKPPAGGTEPATRLPRAVVLALGLTAALAAAALLGVVEMGRRLRRMERAAAGSPSPPRRPRARVGAPEAEEEDRDVRG